MLSTKRFAQRFLQRIAQRCLCAAGLGSMSLMGLVGCQPAPAPPVASQPAADEHAHHHHDEPGPHGGHLVDLQPSGAHAEWAHDDDVHLITVYLDDFDAQKVSEVKFTVEIPDADAEVFALARGDDGWTVTSEALLTHLNMGEAATVKLVVVDDSGEHSSKMEAHEHHHH